MNGCRRFSHRQWFHHRPLDPIATARSELGTVLIGLIGIASVVLAFLSAPALASPPLMSPPASPPLTSSPASPLAESARALVLSQPLPGADVEVLVGDPDPRLDLAACKRAEPFIPTGARLWGKTSLGVRCVEGASWTAFLPTQVKVFAELPVAARAIARGQTVTADDLRDERVELTRYPVGAFASTEPLIGRAAVRAIVAGEPIRRDMLKAPLVVHAGDAVRVVATGTGFAVETEGKALGMASDGQPVQVAVTTGRVVTGIARTGRVVELR